MKTLKLFLSLFFLIAICTNNYSQQLDPDGTRNYMFEDWSGGTTYLEKFRKSNWDQWQHAQARIDGVMFRRNSVPGLNEIHTAQNELWEGFSEMVSNSVWYAGMNSGLMNKSWEYANRDNWRNRFSGDLKIIEICRDAGFYKIVMYMQSPLSKGKRYQFDPAQGGASLEQRVLDCLEYAQYIEANRVQGIEVTYAVIDAFPQKNTFDDRAVYRAAYQDLVETFRDEGLTFEGFVFDGKTDWVKNAGAKILVNDCKYVEETIASATGVELYAAWYTWNKVDTPEQGDASYYAAMNKLLTISENEYMSHYWIAGNKEQGHFPDYINGTPSTRTERVNQAFCTFEGYPDNPTAFGDEILGPINSPDVPPTEPENVEIEINSLEQLTLTWKDTRREDTFKIKKFINGDVHDTVTVGFVLEDELTFVDTTIDPDSTYIYFISAENEFGRTFSEEVEITITTYAPAEATGISADTADCYQTVLNWTDNADNENKFIIIRKIQDIDNDSVVLIAQKNDTSFIDNTLNPGVVYLYNIASLNHIDTTFSSWIEVRNANCLEKPSSPDSLNNLINFCELNEYVLMDISWKDNSFNETGFEVAIKISGDDVWSNSIVEQNSLYKTIELEYDTNYQTRVRAFHLTDTSDWSDIFNFKSSCVCARNTYRNNGEPWQIGDTIQAEFFDYCTTGLVGQDSTYFEPDVEKQAGDTTVRPGELIDLFTNPTNEGDTIQRIGATQQGEYVEYTINIAELDTLIIISRVSNKGDNNVTINYYLDEVLVTTLTYPGKDDWRDYHIQYSEVFSAEAGEYVLRVESATGGTDFDWLIISNDKSLSNKKLSITESVNIYPNPAKNEFTISGVQNQGLVNMYNLQGQKIRTYLINSTVETFSTENLNKGIYLVEIVYNNNRNIQKLIIE